jgi:hypothetical protein
VGRTGLRVLTLIPAILAAWLAPALAALAAAQTASAPAAPPAGGAGGAGALVALVVAALLIGLVVAVKLYDRQHRHEADAVHLQGQLSDALLRDTRFTGLGITPTVHIPLAGSPVRIEVSGAVPGPELREAALRLIRAEASSARPDVEVVDRVFVAARPMRAA